MAYKKIADYNKDELLLFYQMLNDMWFELHLENNKRWEEILKQGGNTTEKDYDYNFKRNWLGGIQNTITRVHQYLINKKENN